MKQPFRFKYVGNLSFRFLNTYLQLSKSGLQRPFYSHSPIGLPRPRSLFLFCISMKRFLMFLGCLFIFLCVLTAVCFRCSKTCSSGVWLPRPEQSGTKCWVDTSKSQKIFVCLVLVCLRRQVQGYIWRTSTVALLHTTAPSVKSSLNVFESEQPKARCFSQRPLWLRGVASDCSKDQWWRWEKRFGRKARDIERES